MYFFFTGFWVRSSVTSAIYRKSLRVSPQGKAESTTGEVVNLMSVDTQRIVDMMPYINMLWRFVKPNYFNKQHFFSLSEVNRQIQNGHGVLRMLVCVFNGMELA